MCLIITRPWSWDEFHGMTFKMPGSDVVTHADDGRENYCVTFHRFDGIIKHSVYRVISWHETAFSNGDFHVENKRDRNLLMP